MLHEIQIADDKNIKLYKKFKWEEMHISARSIKMPSLSPLHYNHHITLRLQVIRGQPIF